jgi:hypothetical protein
MLQRLRSRRHCRLVHIPNAYDNDGDCKSRKGNHNSSQLLKLGQELNMTDDGILTWICAGTGGEREV